MKSIFKLVLIVGLIVPFSGALQAQKTAHLNVNELMEGLPDIAIAQQQVEAFTKELETELQKKNMELQAKYQTFQAEEANMTELIKQSRIQEIQDMEKSIQNFQMVANQQLELKIQELQNPIRDKVTAAIEAVAKEKGYDYILDVSQGTVPYYGGGTDVKDLVRAKL
ncbi:MAG: OmpH family outer membrane protein [Flavobacteriales bacterium]|nr:OmpH family outer membrane protein [Flavobacteriales bacterium]